MVSVKYDVELAYEAGSGGELLDLAAAVSCPPTSSLSSWPLEIPKRYHQLWDTCPKTCHPSRGAALQDLREDAENSTTSVSMPTRSTWSARRTATGCVSGPTWLNRVATGCGLRTLTGLDARRTRLRRLLNDIASFRGHLEKPKRQTECRPWSASRWLARTSYDKGDGPTCRPSSPPAPGAGRGFP